MPRTRSATLLGLMRRWSMPAIATAVVAKILLDYRRHCQTLRDEGSARLITQTDKTTNRVMHSILDAAVHLKTPEYAPSYPLCNTWINIAVFMLKANYSRMAGDAVIPLRRQEVRTADGGKVAIDWAASPEADALPPTAPVVCFLHTVTGSSRAVAPFLKYVTMRGWRACVFLRRGHGSLELDTPLDAGVGSVDVRRSAQHERDPLRERA